MKSAVERMQSWHNVAAISYKVLYLGEYAAFASWYKRRDSRLTDREAIDGLKKETSIWREYLEGNVLSEIRSDTAALVGRWNDWRGLIDRWYQIRCWLIHGEYVEERDVELAYSTLRPYVALLINKERALFTKVDARRLEELSVLLNHGSLSFQDELTNEQSTLRQKYLIPYE
jgi:hypothetical protein